MEPASLKLVLGDGRPATLRLGAAATVLAVGDTTVSSWDLVGRPYALVRDSGTYRRGLDGGLLWKVEARVGEERVRRRLTAREGAPVVEAARHEAALALAALDHRHESHPALARLNAAVAMDSSALAADAQRFAAACGPVGILPPDQYLSLVVRLTEGCAWNECTFCRLYRGVPFRAKSTAELAQHLDALRDYFGPSLALRRSVFLGDANALCLSQDRLLPAIERVAAAFEGRPLYSFVDAWTGRRRTAGEWRELAARGLRRVYVGLETGDADLLAWLGKPGRPEDTVDLVGALHDGGVAAGVIVLLGAGGERFDAPHVERTAALLGRMSLGPRDVVYFSESVEDPSLPFGQTPAESDLRTLSVPRTALQKAAILARFDAVSGGRRPRFASYDIREFVY